MDRIKAFIGSKVDRSRMEDPDLIQRTGFSPRYLPETFDDFDEFDYAGDYEEGKLLILSCVVEERVLGRAILGWAAPGDPDDALHPLNDAEVAKALAARGEMLVELLRHITDS